MRRLIKNVFVVSVDDRIGNIADADILIVGGRIAQIGPGIEANADDVFDGTGHIASPGFVDTHHHIWQTAIRGLTADWSLLDYFTGIRMVTAGFYRPGDMYAANLHGALEALNSGTTTTADYCHNLLSPDHAQEALRGLRDAGARAVWCYGFNSPPAESVEFADNASRIASLNRIAARHFSSREGLITLGVSPEEPAVWARSIDRGRAQVEAARHVDARVFLHTNSVREPMTRNPAREASMLASAGLLGPDVVLVHMGWSMPNEWRVVADAGTHLSFTPETELQMGMNFPQIAAAESHGINFSFGIDIISNNSPDLRTALRLILQAERHRRSAANDQDGLSFSGAAPTCAEALRWGTLDGAKACGLDHKIGSLSPGKSADILLHDARHMTMAGWDRSNPEGTLLLHAGPQCLSTVLVEGEFVKRDFKVAGSDAASRILEQTSAHIYAELERLGGPKAALALGHERMASVLGGAQSGAKATPAA